MQNEDNACIRYLMKEMDPSEEVLMERAMMEDDDLLIEVESLRQTLRRLDELPNVDPPAHVTESVLQEAAANAERRRRASMLTFSYTPFKYAAAAVLLIGFSLGGFWMYTQPEGGTTAGNSAASIATGIGGEAPVITPASAREAEPWVDRQNVIHFDDRYQKSNSEFDSILKNSTKKLTPLSDPFYMNGRPRALQMTGTGNN